MGSYIPHTHTQRRPLKKRAAANWAATAAPSNIGGREQIAREREQQARLEAERRERMAARRERRAIDALRTDFRRELEARAGMLFPWDLLKPDRELAALLTGRPRGELFPIFRLAILFAGVNCGFPPGEYGVAGEAANFMKLAAPRTRSWAVLTEAADFLIASQALEGRMLDRAAVLNKARDALADLEDRLATLPDWLTIHELRGSWFIIRPTRETAKAMWQEVIAGKSGAAR